MCYEIVFGIISCNFYFKKTNLSGKIGRNEMKFGTFDDANKEYVITTSKTTLPWINYLGSNEFFSLMSNTCGGYSFYKDAKLLRLTRYRYNNIPNDEGGRNFYIKEGDSVWSPLTCPVPLPTMNPESAVEWASVIPVRIFWEAPIISTSL